MESTICGKHQHIMGQTLEKPKLFQITAKFSVNHIFWQNNKFTHNSPSPSPSHTHRRTHDHMHAHMKKCANEYIKKRLGA
jgi:hypothetical protein